MKKWMSRLESQVTAGGSDMYTYALFTCLWYRGSMPRTLLIEAANDYLKGYSDIIAVMLETSLTKSMMEGSVIAIDPHISRSIRDTVTWQSTPSIPEDNDIDMSRHGFRIMSSLMKPILGYDIGSNIWTISTTSDDSRTLFISRELGTSDANISRNFNGYTLLNITKGTSPWYYRWYAKYDNVWIYNYVK